MQRQWTVACTITPSWEYWEPNPDIKEILNCPCVNDRLETIHEICSAKERNQVNIGFRFGNGNPNKVLLHQAKERSTQKSDSLCYHKLCPTCGRLFLPERSRQRCCGIECIPRLGKPRNLSDIKCQTCPRVFRPKNATTKFCSKVCFNASIQFQNPESGCLNCGGDVPPSKSHNGEARKFCHIRCKKLHNCRLYRQRKNESKGTTKVHCTDSSSQCLKTDVSTCGEEVQKQ